MPTVKWVICKYISQLLTIFVKQRIQMTENNVPNQRYYKINEYMKAYYAARRTFADKCMTICLKANNFLYIFCSDLSMQFSFLVCIDIQTTIFNIFSSCSTCVSTQINTIYIFTMSFLQYKLRFSQINYSSNCIVAQILLFFADNIRV